MRYLQLLVLPVTAAVALLFSADGEVVLPTLQGCFMSYSRLLS
jgi:hypothetical protein